MLPVYSDNIKTVSAEYTYYAPLTMSVVEAKKIALERAQIKAIEDAFGSIVSQSSTTALSNINGVSDTQFFSVGGSDVKGEWIETIGEPKYGNIFYQDNMLVVPCSVKGKIRQIKTNIIDYIALPLRNGAEKKYESYQFIVGDDLFLYFKSPIDGYLSVFLVDESAKCVYCALPYRNSDGNPKEIQADKEYILFSKKDCELSERIFVDEYVMTANDNLEFNDFYILFSTEPFYKTTLEKTDNTNIPKITSWEDFNKWLAKTRMNDPNLSVSKIIISISK